MANDKIEKVDVYLLAAIAVLSLLLISVELIPIPTSTVVEATAPPKYAPHTRGGVTAFVHIPPAPATMMAFVNVA